MTLKEVNKNEKDNYFFDGDPFLRQFKYCHG